ncbi:hypothetical protein KEM56_004106, partial [Ascosphaera pollenicola]
MFSSLGPAQAYRAAFIEQQAQDEQLFATGQYSRFIFPHHFLNFFVIWLALLIKYPNPRASRYCRALAFAVVFCLNLHNILHVRMASFGHGYVSGLTAGWAILWGSILLVYNDPARDFQRVEYKRVLVVDERSSSPRDVDGKSPAVKVRKLKGTARMYYWQPMPDDWGHRAWWLIDLTLGLRGVGWNYRPPAIPGPPPHVLADLEPKKTDEGHNRQVYDRGNVVSLLKSTVYDIVTKYLALDIIKTLILYDNYFTGNIAAPYPWPFTQFGPLEKILGNTFRLLLTSSAIYYALILGFHVTKLPLILIGYLFPGWPSIPIDEAWLYPPLNGPLISSVAENGLSGLWGRWWHQLFRIAFTSPTRWILHKLGRTPLKAILMTVAAFSLSGLLHGLGSYTTLGPSNPFTGTFLFFFYQALAIVLQTMWSHLVVPKLPIQFSPRMKRIGNYVFVVVWIYHVSSLFADEAASG